MQSMNLPDGFVDRFNSAVDSFRLAHELKDQKLVLYYTGIVGGMLATILPEDEAKGFLTAEAITNQEFDKLISRMLTRAAGVLNSFFPENP